MERPPFHRAVRKDSAPWLGLARTSGGFEVAEVKVETAPHAQRAGNKGRDDANDIWGHLQMTMIAAIQVLLVSSLLGI